MGALYVFPGGGDNLGASELCPFVTGKFPWNVSDGQDFSPSCSEYVRKMHPYALAVTGYARWVCAIDLSVILSAGKI